jgi:uncharacterized membrane protein
MIGILTIPMIGIIMYLALYVFLNVIFSGCYLCGENIGTWFALIICLIFSIVVNVIGFRRSKLFDKILASLVIILLLAVAGVIVYRVENVIEIILNEKELVATIVLFISFIFNGVYADDLINIGKSGQ